jgi:hypothetical protein
VDQLELLTFGFLRRLSAIIHRTVRCDTRLSGVPSGATIASATVDSNGRLTQQTVRAELEQHQKAHQTVRWPRLSELQRLNPNGWVTWLAHRTMSSVPPDSVRCARVDQLELLTFGFLRRLSAIIHRTVRCAKQSNGRQRNGRLQRSADTTNSARRVRAASEVALDSEQ